MFLVLLPGHLHNVRSYNNTVHSVTNNNQDHRRHVPLTANKKEM